MKRAFFYDVGQKYRPTRWLYSSRKLSITIFLTALYGIITSFVSAESPARESPVITTQACLIKVPSNLTGSALLDLQQKIDQAQNQQIKTIIFQFNGKGQYYNNFAELGRDIALLKKKNIDSIAWIPKDAQGMVVPAVFACHRIVIDEFAQFGRAVQPKGEPAIDEQTITNKIVSFARSAGHDQLLARAMGELKITLYQITNGHQKKIVDQTDYETLVRKENTGWSLVGDGPIVTDNQLMLLSGRQAFDLGLAATLATDKDDLAKQLSLTWVGLKSEEKTASKSDDSETTAKEEETTLTDSDGKMVKAVVIRCADMIDNGLFESIKRRGQLALNEGAKYIIFEMDTFGGRVDSAISIWKYIMFDIGDKARTVAYIPTEAFSAGAMISIACNDIIMKPSTKVGDCAPILMGGKLEGVEREKTESALRSYFESAAKANGYPVALCKAMVTMGIEVYQVKNLKTGRYEYFEGDDLPADHSTYDVEGKKLIDPDNKLVTLDAEQAHEYGIARAVVSNLDQAYAFLEQRDGVTIERPVEVMTTTWSEELVRWLTSPAIAGILLAIAMIGIYVELNSPGVGLPGGVALVALALLFGSKYFIGLANWWEIALFFVGFGLLALEIFVIPGFGIAGISGIILMLLSLVAMMVANKPDKLPIPATQFDMDLMWQNIYYMAGAFAVFFVAAYFLSRYLEKIPIASKLVLHSGGPGSEPPPQKTLIEPEEPSIQTGQSGKTIGQLRPSGYARINNRRIGVVTRGEMVDAGRDVEVIEVEGNRIVVKEFEKQM